MAELQILSVDWDYFIMATMETRVKLFPDGGDYAPLLEDRVWQTHYASEPKLTGVKTYTREVAELRQFLFKNINVAVASALVNSHKYCYDFVHKYFWGRPLKIVNIDFHHDVYNNHIGVSHGNWLLKLCEESDKIHPYWVARPSSGKNDMGIELPTISFKEAIAGEYQGVFVCRSGLYSPPHLDRVFVETFNIMRRYPNLLYEDKILENRFSKTFKETCEKLRELEKQYINPKLL